MEEISPQKSCQHDIYLWLNAALLVVVLFLPFSLIYGSRMPAFGVHTESDWILYACLLLLIAITVDGVLSLADWHDHMMGGVPVWLVSAIGLFWIFIIMVALHYLINHPSFAWALAVLFFLHACVAGFSLWRNHDGWWLWFAWWRDITCALALLIWPAYWP